MPRKHPDNIETLKSHKQHYQQIYANANPQGKRLLKDYIQKLEERLQALSHKKI